MVKAKVGAALLLAGLLCFPLQAWEYSWRRVRMDGSRTAGVEKLKGSSAREAALLHDCDAGMAFLKEVVGTSDAQMYKYRPQSPLSNFLADLMLVQGEKFGGCRCDVSISNFGGIRVDMPKGDVMVDDIRSMFPFKNYLVIIKLKGAELWKIFNTMAGRQWEVIGGVRIRATRDALVSLEVGGRPYDPEATYTLVTNSFLLNGGDGLSLADSALECRELQQDFFETVVDYIRDLAAQGRHITGALDDRIQIVSEDAVADRNMANMKSGEGRCERYLCHTPALGKHRLTILHTNDTHSQLEPVRTGRDAGCAGIVERAAFVDSVRRAEGRRNVLLLDAGDFSQGTSYFTVFKGIPEVKALNIMKYDAATMGNHEWDYGLDALADRLGTARFKTLLCNYSFANRKLDRQLKPYAIFRRGGLKIGVIGVLTDVSAAVDKPVADQLRYTAPDGPVNKWAQYLKTKKGCDMVIVLSHNGTFAKTGEFMGDIEMVPLLHNVDLVVGGHTHTDLEAPLFVKDADGREVMILSDFHRGIYVGEIKL